MKNYDDKNIYDMLNDIETDLSEYEREDFNDIEKMKIKKKFRQSIGKKNAYRSSNKIIAAASIGVISLGVISFTPVGTYASKVISDLVFDIRSSLRLTPDIGNYEQTINKSVTKEGITIRVNEAVLNSDELIISITTISDEKLSNKQRIFREASKLYINGELVDKSELSSAARVSKKNEDEVIYFGVDANKYKGTIDVKLEFGNISIYKGDNIKERDIKGPFTFEFKLDTSKVAKNTKEVVLNKEIKLDSGETITLYKYVETPLTQKVYYKRSKPNNESTLVLKGMDNISNKMEFWMYYEANGEGVLIADSESDKIDKKAKTLTLKPYEAVWGGEEIELKPIGEEIKLNISK